MKKFLSILLIGLFAAFTWSCSDDDDDRPVDRNSLPKTAKEFIESYFSGDVPATVTRDGNGANADYDVVLTSGIKIEFDSKGNWKEVESTLAAPIPDQSFIPQSIRDYVKEHYTFQINEISRDKSGYEVRLTDYLELHFDTNGNFVRVDN